MEACPSLGHSGDTRVCASPGYVLGLWEGSARDDSVESWQMQTLNRPHMGAFGLVQVAGLGRSG